MSDTTNLVNFSKGTIIFREGESGNKMYFINRGRVEVSKGNVVIAYLGAGELIGEMSLLLDEPRSDTVKTLNSVEVLEITNKNFSTILTKRSGVFQPGVIGWMIMKSLARRLKVTIKALSEAQSVLRELEH